MGRCVRSNGQPRPRCERRALASLPDERRRIAFLARELRAPRGRRQRGGADRDPADRRELRGRQGHRHLRPGERPGDLLRNELPRGRRHDRDRRAQDDLPGAVSPHRRTAAGQQDPAEYALRALHLHGDRRARGRAHRRGGRRRRGRLQPAGAVRLHAAVQRRQTAARVRAPDAHRAGRRRAAAAWQPEGPADRSVAERRDVVSRAAYQRCSNPRNCRSRPPRRSDRRPGRSCDDVAYPRDLTSPPLRATARAPTCVRGRRARR